MASAAEVAGFYEQVADSAERVELAEAGRVQGLDQEIALLRVRLRHALADRPDDLPLLLKGIGLLVKAVSARYSLSKQDGRELDRALRDAAESLHRQFYGDAADGSQRATTEGEREADGDA